MYHINIVFPQLYFYLRLHIGFLFHLFYMLRLSHPLRFFHSNDIGLRVRIMRILFILFASESCTSALLYIRLFSLAHGIKHSQSVRITVYLDFVRRPEL
jgi:hypothetical protein